MKDNKFLIDRLKLFDQNLRICFDFLITFYRNILTLPDEFVVDKNTFNFSNFSFDNLNSMNTNKYDYIRNQILNFLEERQDILIEFQYEEKLIEIIEIFQKQ